MGPEEPPCAKVIADAERVNVRNGHENLGFLSYRAGFMPLQQPLKTFPAAYSAWDDLITIMPELIKNQTGESAIERISVLSADPQSLPDIHLHCAATFF